MCSTDCALQSCAVLIVLCGKFACDAWCTMHTQYAGRLPVTGIQQLYHQMNRMPLADLQLNSSVQHATD